MSDQQPQDRLTMEQSFMLRAFEAQLSDMTREELIELAVFMREQSFYEKNKTQELLKKRWGL